jgi:predicted Ser/Thr protein kinase
VCPTCKNSLKVVKYVDAQTYAKKPIAKIKFIHMNDKEIKATTNDKTEGEDQIEALYENEAVKSYIYHCTAPYCYDCDKEFRLYIEYKKHVEMVHQNYICELCLKNRHCVLADLEVFETKAELKRHLNGTGDDSSVNHKKC